MGWESGSDTRWRKLRVWVLRLDLPEAKRPRCAIGYPGICTDRATCVDHVVPVSLGGPKYDPNNCRPACAPCNRHRGAPTEAIEQPITRVSSWGRSWNKARG